VLGEIRRDMRIDMVMGVGMGLGGMRMMGMMLRRGRT
jgi:hypothetical protein